MPKTYSTGEAAKKIGVSRQTLQAWIESEIFPMPKLEKVGGIKFRLWSERDIQRARKFKGTLKRGRKRKK